MSIDERLKASSDSTPEASFPCLEVRRAASGSLWKCDFLETRNVSLVLLVASSSDSR